MIIYAIMFLLFWAFYYRQKGITHAMSSSFTKMPGFALGRTIPSEMVQLTSNVGALRGRSPVFSARGWLWGNLRAARLKISKGVSGVFMFFLCLVRLPFPNIFQIKGESDE